MDVLQPDQIFAGRYRILRLLAHGGMGAVFVAEHLATEQQVALKVLWPHLLGSPDLIQSFQLEARVAARLDCEHVVQVLDAGVDDGTGMPFLVMELLRGETLAALVQRAGPLPPERAVACLRQVAAALDRAHGYVDRDGAPRPIIHRDLKPDNIFLVSRPGGEPLVKVLDFGIAKVLSQATHLSGTIKGTPAYMAHEQAIASKITPGTDIWPLGLIAFFLLTGRPFWRSLASEDATVPAILLDLVGHPAYTPTQRISEMGLSRSLFPPSFDEWFAVCTAPEPTHRFVAASAAVEALSMALRGEPFPRPRLAPDPSLPGDSTLRASPEALPALRPAPGLAAPPATLAGLSTQAPPGPPADSKSPDIGGGLPPARGDGASLSPDVPGKAGDPAPGATLTEGLPGRGWPAGKVALAVALAAALAAALALAPGAPGPAAAASVSVVPASPGGAGAGASASARGSSSVAPPAASAVTPVVPASSSPSPSSTQSIPRTSNVPAAGDHAKPRTKNDLYKDR